MPLGGGSLWKLLMRLLFPRVGEGSEGCLPGNGGLDLPSPLLRAVPSEA